MEETGLKKTGEELNPMVRPKIQFSVCPTFGGSNPGLQAELIHSVKEQLSLIGGCAFMTSPVGFMACPSAFASVSNKRIIRGHAVGAGCIFALAHDYRLMSSSRGYLFMNEMDLGMSLTPGNVAVLRSQLPISTFQEAILTGHGIQSEKLEQGGLSCTEIADGDVQDHS